MVMVLMSKVPCPLHCTWLLPLQQHIGAYSQRSRTAFNAAPAGNPPRELQQLADRLRITCTAQLAIESRARRRAGGQYARQQRDLPGIQPHCNLALRSTACTTSCMSLKPGLQGHWRRHQLCLAVSLTSLLARSQQPCICT